MPPLFLGSFLVGLLLAVFAMLHGVERRPEPAAAASGRPDGGDGPTSGESERRPAARLNLPLLAGFATVFGATGYLLHRYSTLATLPSVGVAALVGAVGAFGAVTLIARWALGGAPLDTEDPRYVLQGHLARVTAPIEGGRGGEIAFVVDDVRHVVRARSLDGAPVPLDVEVVIERIEDDVAYVERWAVVEERL
ncbi:MAG: hypothetical protein ACJ79S_19005 [Gemmatimonadaceae bacterium]